MYWCWALFVCLLCCPLVPNQPKKYLFYCWRVPGPRSFPYREILTLPYLRRSEAGHHRQKEVPMYQTSLLAASYLTVCNSVHKMYVFLMQPQLQAHPHPVGPLKSMRSTCSGRKLEDTLREARTNGAQAEVSGKFQGWMT